MKIVNIIFQLTLLVSCSSLRDSVELDASSVDPFNFPVERECTKRVLGGEVVDRSNGNTMRRHGIISTGPGEFDRLALMSIHVGGSDCTLVGLKSPRSGFSQVIFEVAGLSELGNPAVIPRNTALAELTAQCVADSRDTELNCRDAAMRDLRENGVGFSFFEFNGDRFARRFGLLYSGKIYTGDE